MNVRVDVLVLAALSLLLAACGGAATATPWPTPTPLPATPTPLPASAGHRLFITKGCGACHGQNAEGTNIAPALTGHTVGQVKRQVRAPVGLMPVFPPDRVSNQELEEIANYVSGLGRGHAHERPVDPGVVAAQHHWMALFALEDGDQREAVHHLEHVIELVAGDHLARMQKAASEVREGQLHPAAHTVVENMLAGIAAPGLTKQEMHLQLAISASRVEDAINATHHVEHYLELAQAGSKVERLAQAILASLKAGKLAEAEHQLSELAGGGAGHREGGDGGGNQHEGGNDQIKP